MWFGKSIIAKLGFVVALAVPAFAGAPVKPFSFTYIGASNDALQQDEWNYLMKFKMFGTKGIEFGNESIRVTDSVGWFGTSKGSLKMGINGKDTVGGPILVGKDLSFYLGPDVFTTGPLYVAGDVSVLSEGFKDNKSTFAGDVCIGGTVAQYFRDKFVTDEEKSRLHIGSGCPDTVPVIKTNLEIPQNTATKYDKELDGANLKGAGDGSVYETFEIVVPATTDGSDTPYDVHIKSIRMENYSKILVKQPVGGRLTRLFIDDLDIETTKGRIVVAYEDSVVAGKYNELKNDEYLGTLLIYTSSNLKIKTMDKDYAYFQGSIISKGTIHIEQHLILAGQVLADSIYIDTDFDGKSFIYVPFGSPEIDPNLLKDGKWIENSRDSLVPIFLDTIPGTDVKFSYCFEVDPNGEPDPKKDASATPRKAVLADFKKTSKSKFPVCALNQSERVLIKEGNLQPTDETKIYINVISDSYDEGEEILVLKIFDLVGAVMPGNKKEGRFNLVVTDVRPPHFDDDVKSYNVNENTGKGTEFATIPVDGVEIAATAIDKFKLIVGGTDATLAKTLFDFELVKLENSTDPSLYDSAYVKMTVKTADLNYEALTQTSFKLTLSLENDGKITDASDRTINVIDVNEKPGVDKNSSFSVKEEQTIGTEVGEVIATDPDSKNEAFRHLEYTIVSSTPVPFEIPVSTKGVIKTTEKLDYESLKDQDYKYTFDVKVSNCLKNPSTGKYTEACLDTLTHVTVTVLDVNEPPVIIDDGKTFEIDENTKTMPVIPDAVVGKIEVKDVDGADVGTELVVSYVVTDDASSGSKFDDLFVVTDHAVADAEGKLWLVVSVKDPNLLDYEAIKSSYSITMTVKDRGGVAGSNAVTVKKTIVINDVNEAPSITGVRGENDGLPAGETRDALTLYPVENLPVNASIGVVQASDPDFKNLDKFGHLEYRIIADPANPVPFTMKGNTDSTIYVSNASLMNYEDQIVYTFDVEVSNCLKNATTGKYTEHCLADTAKITVKIQNVPEGPEIKCFENDTICDGPFTVAENSATGTIIHAFLVDDPDLGQVATLKATLTDLSGTGADSLFAVKIVKDSLRVYVKDKSKLNYEAVRDTHKVRLTIKDTDNLGDSIVRVIYIVDVNEAPVFATKDTTIEVKENTPNGTVVGKLPASDPDTKHVKEFGHLEYFIIGNNIPFTMDSNKIVVTNVDTLDYESLKPDTVFTFKVQVANCEWNKTSGKYDGACLYDTAKVSLAVTDVPEKTIIIPDCKGDSCTTCTGPDCHDIVDSLCKGPNCTGVHTHDSVLTLAVEENVPTGYKIIDYLVADEDVGTGHKDSLYAYFKNTNASGADSLFKIEMKKVGGQWRVIVSVKDSSKLDYEKVNDIHKLTIYVSDPEDPAGMGDSIRRIIEVVDVNEAPKAKDADLKPEENLPKGTVIGKLDVSEPDTKHVKEFGHLEYSIIGKDETFAFVMDSNKVLVNDPTKMDYELAVHKYVFNVLISNCELNSTSGKYDGACLYDTAKVTVDIQDVNEKPKIIVDGPVPDGDDDSDPNCVAFCDTTSRGVTPTDTLTVGVKENTSDSTLSKTGMVLFTYHVVDEDTGHVAGAKVTWFDVRTTIPSVSTKGTDLFNIEYKNSAITVSVKDQKLLDYEALRDAKSRNDPDPEYTVGIVVTDPDGLSDTLYRTIRVIDVNEKPLFDVWPLVITENNHINDSLGHVEHPSDIDSMSRNPEFYDNGFKMTGGDTALFWLDKDSTDLMRVMIRANVVLDCENGEYICGQDSMYWVYMTYGDTTLKTIYTDLKIPVKLIDLNEPPKILTDTIGVDENSPKGTVVDTIKWEDIDRFDTVMTFKIVDDPIGCFEIDSKTGVVTVSADKCAGLDFEKNPTIDLKVSITDMVNIPDSLYDEKCKCQLISAKDGPITVTKTVKVNIHDVNEPPSISDKTIAVPESTTVWTVIDTVKATDPDKKKEYSTLIYTAVSGDTAVFMIDPHTGAVILKDTLDYESKKNYVVYVQVDDGEFTDTAKVKINVTNVIEKSEVVITKYDNVDSTWNYPDTVYTNKKNGTITWRQDDDIVSKDTVLKKGKNVIVITYKDPSKDLPGSDTVVIMFNDEVPVVEVSANPTHVKAENVFTIVEDMGDADTNIYVNKERDSVYVHVKDPANKRDTSFALEVNLEPVKVPDATFRKMNEIADSKLMLDETPTGPVTRSPVNGNSEKMSYTQLVGGDTVTVSYIVDKDGEPVKASVINSKGKTESVEIITVTYKTIVDDQEVEVSYIADALTGEILAKGPNGELMYQGASSKGSKSGKGKDSEKNSNVSEGIFSVTTVSIDGLGMPTVVSYAVDEKGNMVKNAEGDIGYAVTYTYKNIYGNFATESVFIVLDQTIPTVEILSPVTYSIIRSNFVEVKWTVNGVEQDSLTIQGLEKGPNIIVRFYRDKAGNEASDTVSVMMKDSKSVNIAVEQPVTEIDKDKVEEYYSVNPPKKGETFAVSIKNPSTGKEVETLIGGSFKTKEGSGEEPYPGMDKGHLGPTLALDIKLPVIVPKEGYGTVSGLATLDDIVVSDGTIPLEGVDADNATKISVEEYVEKYCEDGVKIPSDISEFNLYDSKLHAKIWVYTSLGNFVDYFNFKQDLNDPSFTDEAGVLNLYFEQKPDKNGFVKADNGKLYATGAYVYKVEATIRSKLRCTLPSSDFNAKKYRETGDGFGPSAKRKGDVIKNSDELLKSFGYRRPKH
ncbi:Cadherin domain-containing protein [Fibrobacter sp. UWOV1]|uniref:cadherin repeat domain-containing protein n=1 Tax=Fibrobacter sp. UWOV1 TaxID=1896215 RepID=UPI00091A71F8|nr:cadherin repeat domain-containing protein [Fibrobacter sp. UWOV1]SHK34464.1 Cadherin domain-containing protein [Fibrobacter sp. UWOV1]